MLNGIREPDRDYYNDLPGKVPPDIGPPPVPPLPITASTLPNLKHHHHSSQNHGSTSSIQCTPLPDPYPNGRGRHTSSAQQWSGEIFRNLNDLSGVIFRLKMNLLIYFTRKWQFNRLKLGWRSFDYFLSSA